MRRPRVPGAAGAAAPQKIWVVGAAAIATATGAHGEGGSKMRGAGMAAALTASNAELFGSPASMTEAPAAFRVMFAQGLEGYTDDRLADGAGWITFDVASIGARSPSCTAEATRWWTSSTPITPPSSYRREPGHLR
jgi:hypothetical protein